MADSVSGVSLKLVPATSTWPSGVKRTTSGTSPSGMTYSSTTAAVATSCTRMRAGVSRAPLPVKALLAEATSVSSGLRATVFTEPVWPS